MKFSLEHDFSAYAIRAYRPGQISITLPARLDADTPQPVAVETLSTSLIISPRQLFRDWPLQDISALCSERILELVNFDPEVVLLGTGQQLEFPSPELLAELYRRRIGVEVMDTAAACRTYNILMNEGRHVVAGLINQA